VYSTCTSSPWAEAIPSHEHLQPAAVCDTATDDTKKEANCNDWQQAAGPCTYTMVLFLYLHFCSVPVLAFLSRIPLLRRDRDGSRELENRNSCRQWPNGCPTARRCSSACSFCWCLMAGADLFWEKSTASC
jgi:hypothetical protein